MVAHPNPGRILVDEPPLIKALPSFVGIAWLHHTRRALFGVQVPGRGTVYMYAAASSDLAIVEVESERLLKLWQCPTSREPWLAFGNQQSWRADRKFALAEQGFSAGIGNPVGVPLVGCCEITYPPAVWHWTGGKELMRKKAATELHFGFVDGITRTLWLLAHGARSFPVTCSPREGMILSHHAGVSPGEVIRLDEMFSRCCVEKSKDLATSGGENANSGASLQLFRLSST